MGDPQGYQQQERAPSEDEPDAIDHAGANSFPASDPPAGGPAADHPVPAPGRHPSGGLDPVRLRRLLSGIEYPIDKPGLLESARQKGAEQNAIDALGKLPPRRFNSPDDVTEAVGDLS